MKNPLFTRPVFLGSATSLVWKAYWLTPSDTPTEITTAKK